jgi:excisionase family DNA binding protein
MAVTYSTPREVAERIGVSLNTIYAMIQRGDIPVALRVGPRIRLDMDAVVQSLTDREKAGKRS